MSDLATIERLLDYTDWSNGQLLGCAAPVSEADLDRDMEIGPGTLRKTLVHIFNGEYVWLRRWRGEVETKWPSESEKVSITTLAGKFESNARERADFFRSLGPNADLTREQRYRDSRGTLFRANLGDMLLQGVMHSKHHQAQAVNILRRLGAEWPELDYMMRLRKPV